MISYRPFCTTTLNDLCRILNGRLESIAEHLPCDEAQPL